MIRRFATLVCALVAAPLPGLAQPFDPGPFGTPLGSSIAGPPVAGFRKLLQPHPIPNVRNFRDTERGRFYGGADDDPYRKPVVPQPNVDGAGTRLRAAQGRSTIEPDTAGDFARGDPGILNRSGVTRPISPPRRARIVSGASQGR